MKQLIVLTLLIFLSVFQSCKYKKTGLNNPLGEVITVKSSYLHEKRDIYIYIPEIDSSSSIKDLPVLYLLDGETYFNTVVEMLKLFNEANEKGALPKMAVIGIPNTNRDRDLTPSKDLHPSQSASIPMDDEEFVETGGANTFTLFIKNELIPLVKAKYKLSGVKILIGHSFGGLMTINTLFNYSEMFDGYIAIDPSIWWNHAQIVRQAPKFIGEKDFSKVALFYANSHFSAKLAQSMERSDPKNPYVMELDFGNSFVNSLNHMADFNWVHYNMESHGSVPLIAMYDGLQCMDKYFKFRKTENYLSDVSFKRVPSNNENISFTPIMKLYDRLDSISFNSKGYSKDNSYLKFYTDTLHTSPALYKLIGELQVLKGDSGRAVENFESSFSLNPSDSAIKHRIAKMKK